MLDNHNQASRDRLRSVYAGAQTTLPLCNIGTITFSGQHHLQAWKIKDECVGRDNTQIIPEKGDQVTGNQHHKTLSMAKAL